MYLGNLYDIIYLNILFSTSVPLAKFEKLHMPGWKFNNSMKENNGSGNLTTPMQDKQWEKIEKLTRNIV